VQKFKPHHASEKTVTYICKRNHVFNALVRTHSIVMAFEALDNIPEMTSAENYHSIQRFPRFPHKAFGVRVARRFIRRRFYDFNALRG